MTKLRVAVVGVGSLGQHHARIAAGSQATELVAVVESVEARGREIAGKFGTAWAATLGEVLDRVDAVQIAAPTGCHHDLGLRVLAAGKHVIMEKPLAASQEEGRDLLAALERASAAHPGLVAAVGHLERFNPAVTALRAMGIKPHFAEAIRVSPFPMRSMEVDVIMDVMIHDLDLLLALIGRKVISVEAVGVPILTKYTDLVNARLKFEGGAFATVTASRVARKKERVLRAFGANAYASLDFAAQKLEVLRLGIGPDGPRVEQEVVEIVEGEPLKLELEAFYQACLGQGDDIVTWHDAFSAMEVAHLVQISVAESLANLEIRA